MKLSGEERRRLILEQVGREGVTVGGLVRAFGVSEMTIRRDLGALERRGKLVRVHGGAIGSERLAYEYSFKVKEGQNSAAKQAIGEAAARFVRPTDVVFLDTGTTAMAVARAMQQHNSRVVVTSNLAAALEFVGRKDVRTLVTGGEMSPHSPDLYGEWALQILVSINVDCGFFGCDAVDPGDGFYASDTRSAAVTRLMLSRSRVRYLVADSSKFGRRAMCEVAPLTELTGIITDAGLPPEFREQMEAGGIRVILAPALPEPATEQV